MEKLYVEKLRVHVTVATVPTVAIVAIVAIII
jgi:hypothetical protein